MLGYIYIDTGAMYRASTLYFLQHNISIVDPGPEVEKALKEIEIRFEYKPELHACNTLLNGEIVDHLIRSQEVSDHVSHLSTLPAVRKAMVAQQQEMGKNKGVVMDGRDIGTIVLPEAELKVFMTADVETRAKRRVDEIEKKGLLFKAEEVKNNLVKRDQIDANRAVGPLKQAKDAILIDTSNLKIDDQVMMVYELAQQVLLKLNSTSDEH